MPREVEFNIGRARKRVTIQRIAITKNSVGEAVKTPHNVARVWAGITPLMGRELVTAQQYHAETTHLIEIRFRTGITPNLQIVLGARLFTILAALNVEERDVVINCYCKELVANA